MRTADGRISMLNDQREKRARHRRVWDTQTPFFKKVIGLFTTEKKKSSFTATLKRKLKLPRDDIEIPKVEASRESAHLAGEKGRFSGFAKQPKRGRWGNQLMG